MAFPKSVKQLCTPAYIYFLLSVIGIIIAIVQNVGNRRTYSLSSMNVPVPSTIMVFVVKIIGILFWTWVLNLMCKDGHNEIAWFLVLLPFVLLLFMVGTVEGFQAPGMQPQAPGMQTQQQVVALSPAQLVALSPAQVAALSNAQMKALTPAQMKALTPAKMKALPPAPPGFAPGAAKM